MGKTLSRFAILCVAALPACALTGGADTPGQDAARERSFAAGVSALDQGDFALAARHFAPIAAICPVDPTGRRAMLLLAAAELDPRNPGGRPDAAAELSAFQVARPDDADPWAAVLAAELYALSLDYGAATIDAEDLPGPGIIWTRYLMDGDGVTPDAPPAGQPLGAADDSASGRARSAAITTPAVSAPRAGGPACDVPGPDRSVDLPRLTDAPVVARTQAAATPAGGQPRPGGAGEDVRALMAENDRLRAELASKEQELDRIRRTLRP